jgi:hypothetical protein
LVPAGLYGKLSQEEKEMAAVLILVISIIALAQFGLFIWHMAVITIAAEPLSGAVVAAASPKALENNDFQEIASLNSICPDLHGVGARMRCVQAYYRGMRVLDEFFSAAAPSVSAWSRGEMAICTRYAAVVMDQRLRRNQACFAEISSY